MVSPSTSPSMTVDISFLHVGARRLQAWIDSPAAGATPRVGEGESHEAAIGNALCMPRLTFETAVDELDAIRAHERNRTLIIQVRPHHQMRCLGTRQAVGACRDDPDRRPRRDRLRRTDASGPQN